jgi:hypothetical protein
MIPGAFRAWLHYNPNRKSGQEAFALLISEFPKHNLARSAESSMLDLDPQYRPSWMRK